MGEVAQISVAIFANIVKLLRFHNHMFHTNDIVSFFKCVQCPSCDNFFKSSELHQKHLSCKD